MAERQNEYFIEKDGISREVIQADICRYLGNDALVKPGVHQGRQGYFIRAYRNLTSEMIADLKADSARWEAETSRRAERGHPRASYNSSAIHESRQQVSYPPTTGPQYTDPYAAQTSYPPQQTTPGYAHQFNQQPSYPSEPAYGAAPNTYAQGQSSAPVGTSADIPSSYTYTPGNAYSYTDSRSAPRYTGQGYENDGPDYPPASTGMGYSSNAAPDRMMDPRYSPEGAYPDPRGPVSRTLPPRDRDPQRRPR